MSDELTPLEVATRKAFRAFYGDDDPIQFPDLTKEQRQRFEAVALSFEDESAGDERDGFVVALEGLYERITEGLVSVVSGGNTKGFMTAMAMNDKAGAFDVLAACSLSRIRELQKTYERRIPHR